jgi:hypothetical protein
MRNRIVAGLGVAALAALGLAAPATAVSSTTADVYVVHAVPGVVVDVYVNGEITLEGFAPGTSEGPLSLPAGTYTVAIVPEGGAIADAVIDEAVPVAANTSYTLVAHPDAGGDIVLSAFVNDISTIPAGEGKITVRHTAQVGAVDVRSGGTVLIENLANPDEAEVLTLPADTYADINVVPTGTDTRAIELGDVTLPAGTNIFVHAFGPSTGGAFSAVIFTIDDLHATPTGVPAGEPGLTAVPMTSVAGAAVLLALLAGAGLVARRHVVAGR